MVLTIELEGALAKTPGVNVPCKLTSPYRAPLTKFLNKHSKDAVAYFLDAVRLHVSAAGLRCTGILCGRIIRMCSLSDN